MPICVVPMLGGECRVAVGIVESTEEKTIGRDAIIRRSGEGGIMKRKPDILWVLLLIFSLGVVTTGYTQGLWEQGEVESVPISHSSQPDR